MDNLQKTIDYFKHKLINGSLSKSRRKQYEAVVSAMEELGEYKKLKEAGRLIKLPCAVGDTVYEIIHDDIPETIDYICKYTVDDISANAINFAGDWNPLDSIPNVFFSREEAEEALMKLKEACELR